MRVSLSALFSPAAGGNNRRQSYKNRKRTHQTAAGVTGKSARWRYHANHTPPSTPKKKARVDCRTPPKPTHKRRTADTTTRKRKKAASGAPLELGLATDAEEEHRKQHKTKKEEEKCMRCRYNKFYKKEFPWLDVRRDGKWRLGCIPCAWALKHHLLTTMDIHGRMSKFARHEFHGASRLPKYDLTYISTA